MPVSECLALTLADMFLIFGDSPKFKKHPSQGFPCMSSKIKSLSFGIKPEKALLVKIADLPTSLRVALCNLQNPLSG
jgi:hypothetical protein